MSSSWGISPGRRGLVAILALSLSNLNSSPVAGGGGEGQASAGGRRKGSPASGPTFQSSVLPFLEKYCIRCHGGRRKKAGLGLDSYKTGSSVAENRRVWEQVFRMLREREMPPENRPQPSEAERQAIADWVRAELDSFDCSGAVDPGRVTIRRLNRAEYNNTIRDLLGVDLHPADDFPADETGYGFDNIGDVLSLPPLLIEKYVEASERIAEAAIGATVSFRERFEAEQFEATAPSRKVGGRALSIDKEGEVVAEFDAPESGWYLLRARAWGEQAGPEPPRMSLRIDGKELRSFAVSATGEAPRVHEALARIDAGKRRYSIAYLNNYYNPDDPDPSKRGDRNLIVDYFEAQLLQAAARRAPDHLPPSAARNLRPRLRAGKTYQECAREILQDIAMRAYRRPVRQAEAERLLDLVVGVVEEGDSLDEGVKVALEAILSSPHFLLRVEIDEPDSPADIRPVGDYELASRLSYFLWSSMPDDELFELARQGKLHEERILEGQVRRMLAHPKSRALVENFAGQWLQTRFLDVVSPDPKLFPDFDDELRDAMRTETLAFFESILREDRSILEFIDADYTFVNERLARYYGIEGVDGQEFRRVSLHDSPRGGVLTQASFLTITSNPTRTSPVKRGLWILERILGTPPPPPPPDVPDLEESEEAILSGSLRKRLEKHRQDPMCASCHDRMDPIGFAFENFDAVGKWREFDGKFLIDPSGTLPDGRAFEGSDGLKSILLAEKELLAGSLAEKMLTYALGRGLEYYDKCAVDQIMERLAASDYRFSSLILAVARTDPFLKRRGEEGR